MLIWNPTFGCTGDPVLNLSVCWLRMYLICSVVPHLRETIERYVGCIYVENGSARIRVWNADTAAESTCHNRWSMMVICRPHDCQLDQNSFY